MRRDLARALGALERHELDLAFGNAANLDRPLPPGTTARLVTTDPIAVLVNVRGVLAERGHVTPADLVRRGVWWPSAGSSAEVRGFAEEYVGSIGASLRTEGSNLGLDALLERVATDPDLESRPTFLFFKGAANGLFDEGAAKLSKGVNDQQALLIGIKCERGSHNFFKRYGERFEDSQGKQIFLEFAAEEREHLDLLIREYRALTDRQRPRRASAIARRSAR